MKIKERNYSHPNGSTRHIEFVKNYDETYDIIRITYVNYRRTWYDGKDVYFSFCPKGCVKSPSTHFHDYYDTIDEVNRVIAYVESGEKPYISNADWDKYVLNPNRKNCWGFCYESLMKLMKAHKKSDKKIQYLLEERLTDANYHSYRSCLSHGDYDGFEELTIKEFPFKEEFKVETFTPKKAIKNPSEVAEGIKSAILNYLFSVGLETTEVVVNHVKIG